PQRTIAFGEFVRRVLEVQLEHHALELLAMLVDERPRSGAAGHVSGIEQEEEAMRALGARQARPIRRLCEHQRDARSILARRRRGGPPHPAAGPTPSAIPDPSSPAEPHGPSWCEPMITVSSSAPGSSP